MRVISLVPSATEMICALGLGHQLVGVSHECDYPVEVQGLPRVTRSRLAEGMSSDTIDAEVSSMLAADRALYELDEARLVELEPDVIVTQSLCEVCAVSDRQVDDALRALNAAPRIVRLSPTCLQDVFEGMREIGRVCEAADAETVVSELQQRVDQVAAASRDLRQRELKVLLLEWIDPLFCAGHWNPELIELAGGWPVLGQTGQPSRRIPWSEVQAANPDAIVIACCGFSIDRTVEDMPTLVSYPGFAKLNCIRAGQLYLANGSDYFNRPGPRLVDSLELLAFTLFPETFTLREGIERAARVQPVQR